MTVGTKKRNKPSERVAVSSHWIIAMQLAILRRDCLLRAKLMLCREKTNFGERKF